MMVFPRPPRPRRYLGRSLSLNPRFSLSPWALALLLVLTLAPTQGMGQTSFGIEDVLSTPFPEGLVSAPEAGLVAWVYNQQGVRNIWAMSPEWAGPRQITDYQEDDGQAISGLIVTPNGESILYTRGGAPNSSSEIPNPQSWVAPAERALWSVPVAGGEPRKLGKGERISLSPDGEVLAYTGPARSIWTIPVDEDGRAEKRATIRGGPGSLTWAPDGTRIAFVSNRGDHSFVGVLDLDSGTLTYLDPGLTQDRNPVWSPDGTRIAFIRATAPDPTLPFSPTRSGLPWSIRVFDLSKGEGETVWTADEGPGSLFHNVSASSQLWWGAEDRIVFPWEGNGWLNLYSVPARGGAPTPLANGPFEVQFVSLSADGRSILYSGNEGDIDRQHVWRVPVTGGPPSLLTSGEGIEWSPVPAGTGGAVAFLASGATTPARAEILDQDGSRRRLIPEGAWEDFPAGALSEPKQVVFPGTDGLEIHGQLFLPGGHEPGQRYPAVLFFHGGSRRQMLLGFHHRGYYHNAYAFNQFLANQGYIVLSVNYRSGIGYGLDFREAPEYGATGASEFRDVLGAGLYLRSRADVDPARIGLWGGSYGGYLTAMGLARASDLFAAGVDLHGVHDWNVTIKNFVPNYETEAHPEFAALAWDSSPMADLDGWRSPVLLIHGDDDRNVPFSESVTLSRELKKRGVTFESLVFPDEVHGFLLHASWLAAFEAAADFFHRMLAGGD